MGDRHSAFGGTEESVLISALVRVGDGEVQGASRSLLCWGRGEVQKGEECCKDSETGRRKPVWLRTEAGERVTGNNGDG